MMDDLSTLAIQYGTDKGPQGTYHGYTVIYDALFGQHRTEIQSVLEIGVYQGASLRMWRDYFPSAKIVGLDYAQEVTPEFLMALNAEDRMAVLVGEQENPADLARVMQHGPFDLVVDDGSHAAKDFLCSFHHLWPYTKRWYVIEDIMEEEWDTTVSTVQKAEGYACHIRIVSRTDNRRAALVVVR